MLVSFDALAQQFAGYTDVKGKIRPGSAGGRLVQVARGLYETDARTDGKYLAGAIYGRPTSRSTMPVRLRAHSRGGLQYLYFGDVPQGQDQALRERLRDVFCTATFPAAVYPLGVEIKVEGGYSYQIASPEKGAVRQAVFAFARVFGEGAQRTAVRRSAHRTKPPSLRCKRTTSRSSRRSTAPPI